MESRTIEIKATPKQCYKVITAYDKYGEFLGSVNKVKVKNKKGNTSEVTFYIRVIKDINYTLKMKGTPDKKVEWSFVEGNMMKDNKGYWELKELKKGVTEATYNIDIKFGLLVPGAITKKLVGTSLPSMLKEFKQRIESAK